MSRFLGINRETESSQGQYPTGSVSGNRKFPQDTRNLGTVYSVGTDAVDSFSEQTNTVTAASHAAKKGDTIRFTSGVLSGLVFTVYSVGTNTIKLYEYVETTPSALDTFTIYRYIPQVVSTTGASTVDVAFDRNGASTSVVENTTTPASDRPLPVREFGYESIGIIRNAYASVNVTTAAYVELSASLPGNVKAIQIFDSSGQSLVLATGAAASEANKLYIVPGGNGLVPLRISAAVRLSVKAVSGTANVGELLINLLG